MSEKFLVLKAPGDERNFFEIPFNVRDLSQSYNGNFTAGNGHECRIENNIIDVLQQQPHDITLAQNTNFWGVTAKLYEDTWRKRSIGIISGMDFSLEDEKRLLQTWLNPQPGEWILDVGCSTAFYARAAAEKEPEALVIALDFSRPMLEEARVKAGIEHHKIFLLRADASAAPFYSDSVDAMVCGGSLNEFSKPEKVLFELKRIIKPGGRIFMMHLLQAPIWFGRIVQQGSKLGGLHFWTENESEALFNRAGFKISRRHRAGIVMFSLLEPV